MKIKEKKNKMMECNISEPITYQNLLQVGRSHLEKMNILDAALDSRYLLEYVTGQNNGWLFLHGSESAEQKEIAAYTDLIKKRARHIPLQHLTGVQEFMGLSFYVNEHVLVPRQDTECLVEMVLPITENKKILDMCTGSGCIAISLAVLGKAKECTAVDLSDAALEVAKKNARINRADVKYVQSDLFEKIDDTKDYQVIFIDVHLSKSINGIDFSIELKKRFPKALIVFVTMNNNFVHKSMELQPFYFIRKDHLNEDMSIFFKMFKEHLENTSFIVINAREKRVRINTSDIIYIEADGHYLKIITLDGEYKFKEKIKEFQKQLNNNNIIQVHRSYLINLDFVYDVNSKFIILRNKKEINIGKTYKKKFKLTYQDYLLNGSL